MAEHSSSNSVATATATDAGGADVDLPGGAGDGDADGGLDELPPSARFVAHVFERRGGGPMSRQELLDVTGLQEPTLDDAVRRPEQRGYLFITRVGRYEGATPAPDETTADNTGARGSYRLPTDTDTDTALLSRARRRQAVTDQAGVSFDEKAPTGPVCLYLTVRDIWTERFPYSSNQ